MIKGIAVVLCGLSIMCNAWAIDIKVVSGVYNTILYNNNIKIRPMLYLILSRKVNARSNMYGIGVNVGMIEELKNKDELAMILSHELAHKLLHHPKSTPSREYEADKLGSILMLKAGYNICNGVHILKRLKWSKKSKTHPSSVNRYNRLRCRRHSQ